MEQYNFLKGIHPQIDEEILKIQLKTNSKKTKAMRKQPKTVWDPSFFEPPEQQSSSSLHEESKTFGLGQNKEYQHLNITHLKKNELFEILKNVMLQFLQKKKLPSSRFKKLLDNCDAKQITKKVMKEKIMNFAKLLSIPMVYHKKTTRFEDQSRTVTKPHYNLKQTSMLKNIFKENNDISFTLHDTSKLTEEKYLLYCILASIKFYYPNLIPHRFKCFTFLNIYQIVQPKNYSDIQSFVRIIFPSIFFVIQENGYNKLDERKKFSRYIFINDAKTIDSIKILSNPQMPKIYLKRNVSATPYTVTYRLLTSSQNKITLPIGKNIEFCVK